MTTREPRSETILAAGMPPATKFSAPCPNCGQRHHERGCIDA